MNSQTTNRLEAFIRRYDADQHQINKQLDQIFAKLEKLTTHFHQRIPPILLPPPTSSPDPKPPPSTTIVIPLPDPATTIAQQSIPIQSVVDNTNPATTQPNQLQNNKDCAIDEANNFVSIETQLTPCPTGIYEFIPKTHVTKLKEASESMSFNVSELILGSKEEDNLVWHCPNLDIGIWFFDSTDPVGFRSSEGRVPVQKLIFLQFNFRNIFESLGLFLVWLPNSRPQRKRLKQRPKLILEDKDYFKGVRMMGIMVNRDINRPT